MPYFVYSGYRKPNYSSPAGHSISQNEESDGNIKAKEEIYEDDDDVSVRPPIFPKGKRERNCVAKKEVCMNQEDDESRESSPIISNREAPVESEGYNDPSDSRIESYLSPRNRAERGLYIKLEGGDGFEDYQCKVEDDENDIFEAPGFDDPPYTSLETEECLPEEVDEGDKPRGRPKGRSRGKAKETVDHAAKDPGQKLPIGADGRDQHEVASNFMSNSEGGIDEHGIPKETAECVLSEVGDKGEPSGRPRGKPRGRPKGKRSEAPEGVATLPRGEGGPGRKRGWPKGRPRLKGVRRKKPKEGGADEGSGVKTSEKDTNWLNPETGLVESGSTSRAEKLERTDYYRIDMKRFAMQKERKAQILASDKPSFDDLIFLKKFQNEKKKRRRAAKIEAPKRNCQICQETLTRQRFNHAFLCHGLEYRDVCAICLGRDFANLEEHYRTIHWEDTALKCHLCSAVFYSEKALQNHVVSHTSIDPLQCRVKFCKFHFGSEEELKEHMRSAHELAPRHAKRRKEPEKRMRCETACEICGKMVSATFQKQLGSRLLMHKRKYHEVQNHLKCPSCDRTFITYAKLSIHHTRAHTPDGERPFICRFENCNKTFKTSYNLKTHTTYHKPPKFQCDKCQLKFYWIQPWKIHKCAATLARRMRLNDVHTSEEKEN